MAAHPAAGPLEGLLAEAGRLLGASLEVEDTLRAVARVAVPELASWAAVETVEPGGARHVAASGHPDPVRDAHLHALRDRLQPAGDAPAHGVVEDAELGRTSFLVVALTAGDRHLGTLTLLSPAPRPPFSDADLPVALEIAERCSQALHNAQLYDEAVSARALLDTVFATAPVGLGLVDRALRFLLVNERMAAFNRRPIEAHLGCTFEELLGDVAASTVALIGVVLDSGEPLVDVEVEVGDRAFLASYAPVVADGRVLGVVCAVVDVSERQRARAERDRVLERTARLQEVTERLSAALTEDEVAEVILRAGMTATGATCGVLGLRDDDALVVGHRIGMGGSSAPTRLPLDLAMPMPRAALSARPVLMGSRRDWLDRWAHPPRGDFEAFAAVPLLFEGGVPGVMGFGFPDRREFDEGDVEMLVAIARQGAQALERARLYEERAYVARTLQRGLLPRRLPDVPGLDIAVRYRPIGDGSEVGGDFYDVVPAGDAWVVAVGDVCGKGAGAAVLTGVVRTTIRALAGRTTSPADLVAGVNDALLAEGSPDALSAVACGQVGRSGDAFAIRLAVGGHPPPMVRRASGEVERVDVRGPMLGVAAAARFAETAVCLAPGDVLLLYTDGIIDARRAGGPPFGEDRLAAALGAAAGAEAATVLAAVDAAVRAYAPGPPRDDKALLALRVA